MLLPWDHTRIGIRSLTEPDLDFEDDPQTSWRDPVGKAIGDPTVNLDLGVTMPQAVNIGIHHRWDDRLNLLASAGWDEISEFGRIQVEIDGNGIPGTTVNEDFRDVWNFGVGAEYQWKPKLQLTAGIAMDTIMSASRTRSLAIPMGSRYRYAIGFKQQRDGGIFGGGLTWLYEGTLPVEDKPGMVGAVTGKCRTVPAPPRRYPKSGPRRRGRHPASAPPGAIFHTYSPWSRRRRRPPGASHSPRKPAWAVSGVPAGRH